MESKYSTHTHTFFLHYSHRRRRIKDVFRKIRRFKVARIPPSPTLMLRVVLKLDIVVYSHCSVCVCVCACEEESKSIIKSSKRSLDIVCTILCAAL